MEKDTFHPLDSRCNFRKRSRDDEEDIGFSSGSESSESSDQVPYNQPKQKKFDTKAMILQKHRLIAAVNELRIRLELIDLNDNDSRKLNLENIKPKIVTGPLLDSGTVEKTNIVKSPTEDASDISSEDASDISSEDEEDIDYSKKPFNTSSIMDSNRKFYNKLLKKSKTEFKSHLNKFPPSKKQFIKASTSNLNKSFYKGFVITQKAGCKYDSKKITPQPPPPAPTIANKEEENEIFPVKTTGHHIDLSKFSTFPSENFVELFNKRTRNTPADSLSDDEFNEKLIKLDISSIDSPPDRRVSFGGFSSQRKISPQKTISQFKHLPIVKKSPQKATDRLQFSSKKLGRNGSLIKEIKPETQWDFFLKYKENLNKKASQDQFKKRKD